VTLRRPPVVPRSWAQDQPPSHPRVSLWLCWRPPRPIWGSSFHDIHLAALAAAKKHKAKLVVAKLDRLCRNTRFLLTLLDSGVEVLFCDLPEVTGAMGRFILIGMANVAELEAGLISERTKAGLAIAKQRGVQLGRTGAEILAPKFRAEAKARAEQLAPVIRELQRNGYTMRGIASELEKRKVPTPRAGAWHP
jgi:DNA invertase Pin-like site-specific DNA recombinase